MGRRPAALAVAAALALAAADVARADITATLRICGARACRTVKTDESRLHPVLFGTGVSSYLPPPVGGFYALALAVEGAPRVQRGWYVPGARVTRWLSPVPTEWTRIRKQDAAFLERLAFGPPRRAPRPVRVTVARHDVRDTRPYVHVFDRLPRAPLPRPRRKWISIHVLWPSRTPWRFEHDELSALPAQRILARPGGWFRIPPAFADAIKRDARRP